MSTTWPGHSRQPDGHTCQIDVGIDLDTDIDDALCTSENGPLGAEYVCTWISPESFFPFFRPLAKEAGGPRWLAYPMLPHVVSVLACLSPSNADSILSWAAINPHQPSINPHQPSLTPKKPDPHPPVIYRLHQSGGTRNRHHCRPLEA